VEPAVASALLLAAASLGVGLLTYRNNRAGMTATNAIENRKVDQSEFDSITRELRASLVDVRRDLDEEREMREKADERAAAAEQRAQRAEERADAAERKSAEVTGRLTKRVEQLEQVLRENDMTVPPALPD
jgi:flagellar biosynthesis GTPase FlhF